MDTKNKEIKLKAVIIEEKDYNEYDKLLTLFTDKLGKINVYCFNVRRAKSKNLNKTNLFGFGDFTIKETKNGYTLYEVKMIEYFYDIASDYKKFEFANEIIDYIKYFGMENIEDEKLLKLTVYTLNAIKENRINISTIKAVFKTKLLSIEGFLADTEDIKNNIEENVKYTLNEIRNREIKNLYTFELSDELRNKTINLINYEYKDKVGNFYD